MKKETKLQKIIDFCRENKICYFYPPQRGERGHSDLVIPKYRICIKLSTTEEEDQEYYETHKKFKFPVFIRDTDAPKFVIEKVQQTIIKFLFNQQRRLTNLKKKEEGQRIFAENKAKHDKRIYWQQKRREKKLLKQKLREERLSNITKLTINEKNYEKSSSREAGCNTANNL